MSLAPHWHSSEFGLELMALQCLAAFAFALLSARDSPARLCDAGAVLITLSLFSFYLLLMEYLTVWSGNLPDEIAWYQPRSQGVWGLVAATFLALCYAVPLLALLPQKGRSSRPVLRWVSAGIVVGTGLQYLWLVVPSTDAPAAIVLPALLLALGGLGLPWLAVFRFGKGGGRLLGIDARG
jgi:hypothetical protein